MQARMTETEIVECLKRSGYLLEGRLIEILVKAKYFVEPSTAYKDIRTGISREIDVVARNLVPMYGTGAAGVSSTLVVESINNSYPVVLLTPNPDGPTDTDHIIFSSNPGPEIEPHPFLDKVFGGGFLREGDWVAYSQYCTFARKKDKGEFMALHSDDLHGSIQKCAEFLTSECKKIRALPLLTDHENNWNFIQWQGLIVLNADLYVFRKGKVREVPQARLQYNFHLDGEPETVVLTFLTEKSFSRYINNINQTDVRLQKALTALKAAG